MPSRNTRYARKRGYSDIIALRRGDQKNYGSRLGVALDTEGLRQKNGKNPTSPVTNNNSHWSTSNWERKRRKGLL